MATLEMQYFLSTYLFAKTAATIVQYPSLTDEEAENLVLDAMTPFELDTMASLTREDYAHIQLYAESGGQWAVLPSVKDPQYDGPTAYDDNAAQIRGYGACGVDEHVVESHVHSEHYNSQHQDLVESSAEKILHSCHQLADMAAASPDDETPFMHVARDNAVVDPAPIEGDPHGNVAAQHMSLSAPLTYNHFTPQPSILYAGHAGHLSNGSHARDQHVTFTSAPTVDGKYRDDASTTIGAHSWTSIDAAVQGSGESMPTTLAVSQVPSRTPAPALFGQNEPAAFNSWQRVSETAPAGVPRTIPISVCYNFGQNAPAAFTFRAEMSTAGPSTSTAGSPFGGDSTSLYLNTLLRTGDYIADIYLEAADLGLYYTSEGAENTNTTLGTDAGCHGGPHYAADTQPYGLLDRAAPLLPVVDDNALPAREGQVAIPSSEQNKPSQRQARFTPRPGDHKARQKYRNFAEKHGATVDELLPFRVFYRVRCEIAHPVGLTKPCIGISDTACDSGALYDHVKECAERTCKNENGRYACLWSGCEFEASDTAQLKKHLLRLKTHFCAEAVRCPSCHTVNNQASNHVKHLEKCKALHKELHTRHKYSKDAAAAANPDGSQKATTDFGEQ
ncbi:hypothetical protein BD626DRAFT_636521 [Schizophyllum amplum]|uniref:Uncharacterized protein n=1 Tax=Schizophyllum amplum TaxID=97359 RepID=A0A550BT60_9AGAR|nr:hypothetical protein BD626DRAFT_636521 [Auriculariopsis ampla]